MKVKYVSHVCRFLIQALRMVRLSKKSLGFAKRKFLVFLPVVASPTLLMYNTARGFPEYVPFLLVLFSLSLFCNAGNVLPCKHAFGAHGSAGHGMPLKQ